MVGPSTRNALQVIKQRMMRKRIQGGSRLIYLAKTTLSTRLAKKEVGSNDGKVAKMPRILAADVVLN